MQTDPRLPIRFGPLESRRPNEAVLLDNLAPAAEPAIRFEPGSPGFNLAGPNLAGHNLGCACCTPRPNAARALADLFRQRALAHGPAFVAVLAVVTPATEAVIRTALFEDLVVAARYRLMPQ